MQDNREEGASPTEETWFRLKHAVLEQFLSCTSQHMEQTAHSEVLAPTHNTAVATVEADETLKCTDIKILQVLQAAETKKASQKGKVQQTPEPPK